jgi:hypothetical protein
MKLKMPNRIALFFSLILSIVAFYFLFRDNSSSIDPLTKDFSFGRVDNITEIHISDKSKSITLIKSGNDWFANDKYLVKEQLPELFLSTINSIKVKTAASKQIRNQLRDQLLNSKHIDIYKGHYKICSYYLLFDSAFTQGTYLMKRWAKLPMEAEIAGLQIPVISLYHTDLDYWKAKFVFPVSVKVIEWVSLENISLPSASFKLERTISNGIKLTALASQSAEDKVDLIAANDYIASIPRVQYIKEVEGSDSIDINLTEKPLAEYTLRVKTVNQNPIVLNFFPYFRKGMKGSIKSSELFIGQSSLSSKLFIGRYTDFDPLIRNLNYFLNK